jgi:hypothetical protein
MQQHIDSVVPLDNMLTGITADLLGERDPAGESFNRLLAAVERHATLETDALGSYEHLAEASEDPVIALVMRLILEDEERHHNLLRGIAATLRDALNWTYSSASLPHTMPPSTPVGEDLAVLARALVDEEQKGAQALRRLADQERGLGSGLDSVLLEMMAMDSEKHARLLRFVENRLEARDRIAAGG